MLRIELVDRIVNLPALEIRPLLFGMLDGRLHGDPTAKRAGGQHQTSTTTRCAYDATTRRIERSRTSGRWNFGATDAAIERWSKSQHRQHPNLQRQEALLGRRPSIECPQKPDGRVEHRRLYLILGHALPNRCHRRTCGPDRFEVSQDVMKGTIDRYALEVRKLAAPRSKLRFHEHIGLKRATEPTLASPRTPRERGDFPMIFGQERDDSIGVAVVDGA